MAPMYYRGAQASLLVYDITNPTSFEELKGWVKGMSLARVIFFSALCPFLQSSMYIVAVLVSKRHKKREVNSQQLSLGLLLFFYSLVVAGLCVCMEGGRGFVNCG